MYRWGAYFLFFFSYFVSGIISFVQLIYVTGQFVISSFFLEF